jgi:hypothetical protein
MCGVPKLPNDAHSGVFRQDLAMLPTAPIASPQQSAHPPTQFPSSGVPQNTPSAQPAPYTQAPLPPRRRRFRPFGRLPLDSGIFAIWGFFCFYIYFLVFSGSLNPSLGAGDKDSIGILCMGIVCIIGYFMLRRGRNPSLGLWRRLVLEMGLLLITIILIVFFSHASFSIIAIILAIYGLVTFIVALL